MMLSYRWNKYKRSTDTEYYMQMHDNKMILCINATDLLPKGLFDWIINLLFMRLPIILNKHLIFVHWGLWKKAKSIYQEVLQFIKNNKPQEIEFTGYSQGSCIQYLYAMLIKNYPQIKCLIAGSFRPVGFIGKRYLRKLCKNIINIQCGNDIVTKIPFFMHHVGKIYRFGGQRKLFKLSIQDHLPNNYFKLMENIKEYIK